MKNIIISAFFLVATNIGFSQIEALEKAPKEKSISIGYSSIIKNTIDSISSTGISLEFDYAWKLSGYNKKPAAYISVPIGYTSFTLDNNKHFSLLYYGWTVRHELTKDKKVTPYLGYSLLLNQLRMIDVDGSMMGHQTKFELGGNLELANNKKVHLSLSYSLYRFPQLERENTNKMQNIEFKTGFRF